MSLGALTTTFTPPSSCISSFSNVYIVGSLGYVVAGPVSTNGCFPSGYDDALTNYYSPGICPSGYTAACSSSNNIGSLTETSVTCCPTSFDCNPGVEFAAFQSTLGCTLPFVSLSTIMTYISNGTTVSTATSTAVDGGFNAFSVQVRFQSTDFPSATSSASTANPTSSTSSISQSTGTTTASSSITNASTASTASASNTGASSAGASATSTGKGKGISSGAAAGIGVGSALGALLVASVAGFAFFLGRRSARQKKAAAAAEESGKQTGPVIDGQGGYVSVQTRESQSAGPMEMQAASEMGPGVLRNELPTVIPRELDGTAQAWTDAQYKYRGV